MSNKIQLNLYIKDNDKLINFNEIKNINTNSFNDKLKESHRMISGHGGWLISNGRYIFLEAEKYISLCNLNAEREYLNHINDFEFKEIKYLSEHEKSFIEKEKEYKKNIELEKNSELEKKFNDLFKNKINHIEGYIKERLLKNNLSLECIYEKKFNDLFENTSDIIKELKKDLNNKEIDLRVCQELIKIHNEEIKNLELEVHYLKSQIEKKVEIDYESIKKRNKNLNNEFKRVAKLMKLGSY